MARPLRKGTEYETAYVLYLRLAKRKLYRGSGLSYPADKMTCLGDSFVLSPVTQSLSNGLINKGAMAGGMEFIRGFGNRDFHSPRPQ